MNFILFRGVVEGCHVLLRVSGVDIGAVLDEQPHDFVADATVEAYDGEVETGAAPAVSGREVWTIFAFEEGANIIEFFVAASEE